MITIAIITKSVFPAKMSSAVGCDMHGATSGASRRTSLDEHVAPHLHREDSGLGEESSGCRLLVFPAT